MNLRLVLRALGVTLSDEDIKRIEEIIPQIPSHLNGAIKFLNSAVTNFDERLKAIEETQVKILEVLNVIHESRGLGRIDESKRVNGHTTI